MGHKIPRKALIISERVCGLFALFGVERCQKRGCGVGHVVFHPLGGHHLRGSLAEKNEAQEQREILFHRDRSLVAMERREE